MLSHNHVFLCYQQQPAARAGESAASKVSEVLAGVLGADGGLPKIER